MTLLFWSPETVSVFEVCFAREDSVFEMRSDAILSEETSVVNIAPAIKTPHTALRPNFSETAKTGIEELIPSAKTTV